MQRRNLVLATASAALVGSVRAQGASPRLPVAPSAEEPYARLQGGVPHHMTPEQEAQRFTESPAPAGAPGRWVPRAALPIPRSEMAWATAAAGRMHVVGGYGEGAVNRDYHHIYDPAADRWLSGAPLPRGANHVAVAADAGRVYAFGGFVEQNRRSDTNAYAYEIAADRWVAIAPLPRPRGAAAAVVMDGAIHLIGGASEPASERASVGWHEVYDPKTDRWSARKALPGARDHVGCVSHNGQIHVIGGRFNTFEYNTDLHHAYLPARDTWELRSPLPTARSGHGLVVYRGRFYAMGGEGGILVSGVPRQAKVFGQMESYDPSTDTWQRHAPMPTPRHAVGAAVIGDWIYVAGGGAVLGGAVQSAVHEAFTLG
ncbi:kelch repeat-containing protein [Variovorax sp. J22P240]|uniref:Kelch repeat-containing protein n=1 Tax=unclassified Variovorax TaxID=663243 RepID=UPI0025764454|nr:MULTISPECIES: kelch repeat-containing protein [unclassified Variovorax]MDL9998877.1 kelch repeat-containing protein [Variovorax sp. J22P240]MDM0053713.1 kelch repeat-containing protein [Variovorax sp. J22R115]